MQTLRRAALERLVLDGNRHRALPRDQREREIVVRSERDLRDAIAAVTDVDRRIVFDTQEIALKSAVSIRSHDKVVLEGRGREPTTIRCRTDGAVTALFVRCGRPCVAISIHLGNGVCRGADVRLERLRFVGCGDSAVVVEPDTSSLSRGAQSAEFDAVEFSQNGQAERLTSGAAVRTSPCPGESCRRLSLRFRECLFLNNSALNGGAIFAENANLEIRMSTFEGNEAANAGGAIYTRSGRNASLIVEDSEFARNAVLGIKADDMAEETSVANDSEAKRICGTGGAILAHSPLSIDIRASVFVANTGCKGGGAVSVVDRGGGGVDTDFNRVFTVSDSVFRDNVAFCRQQRDALNFTVAFGGDNERGGALAYEAMDERAATWSLKNSLFFGNRAVVGGALYFRGTGSSISDNKMTACQLDGNAAIVSGGTLHLMTVRMTISGSRFRRSKSIFGGIILSAGQTLLRTERDPDDPEAITVLEDACAYYGGAIASNSGGQYPCSLLLPRAVSHCSRRAARPLGANHTKQHCLWHWRRADDYKPLDEGSAPRSAGRRQPCHRRGRHRHPRRSQRHFCIQRRTPSDHTEQHSGSGWRRAVSTRKPRLLDPECTLPLRSVTSLSQQCTLYRSREPVSSGTRHCDRRRRRSKG